MVRRFAASELCGCHKLVYANVYGLCWSGSLLAKMECAAPFSPLVIQSVETSSGYGFEERRVRPLCHLVIRQQTWQEFVLAAAITRLQQHRPTRKADSVHSSRAQPRLCGRAYSLTPRRRHCGACAR